MMFVILLISCNVFAGDIEKETTNERLIRVEETVKATNQRIDDTNKQIDLLRQELRTYNQNMNQRFDDFNYRMLMFFVAIIAIIIWDRRTALKPIYDQFKDFKERLDFLWESYHSDNKEGLKKFKPAS